MRLIISLWLITCKLDHMYIYVHRCLYTVFFVWFFKIYILLQIFKIIWLQFFFHFFVQIISNSRNCFIRWKLFENKSAKHVFIISNLWRKSKLYNQTQSRKLWKLEMKTGNWKMKASFENDTKRTLILPKKNLTSFFLILNKNPKNMIPFCV